MTPREPRNPRIVLLEDHRRIDALLDRLIATVRADDREAASKQWRKVEAALLAHLDVEEMFVFPALRDAHGAEVDRLRKEHAAIRSALGDIGLSFELHTVRCGAIESFCSTLREHSEREDSLVYVEAERSLPLSIARSIAERIKSVAASARAPRSRTAPVRSAP